MVLSLDKGGILRAVTITPRGTNTDTTDADEIGRPQHVRTHRGGL
jgi:hypothetical protein